MHHIQKDFQWERCSEIFKRHQSVSVIQRLHTQPIMTVIQHSVISQPQDSETVGSSASYYVYGKLDDKTINSAHSQREKPQGGFVCEL